MERGDAAAAADVVVVVVAVAAVDVGGKTMLVRLVETSWIPAPDASEKWFDNAGIADAVRCSAAANLAPYRMSFAG